MKAGCLKSRRRGKRRASFIFLRRWQLKKRKSSKQPCENAKGGCSDHREPPRSSGSRGPRWNRRFGHSKSTKIASRLSRELQNSGLIFGQVVAPSVLTSVCSIIVCSVSEVWKERKGNLT